MIRKLIILAILVGGCLLNFFGTNSVYAENIPVAKVKEHIVKHSLEMGVDPALALSIAKHESGFRHESKGRDGTVGVFQLKPSTAKRLGYNPYTLNGNIQCALKYYQMMYKKFGSMELALAAYNAGPGNVAKYKGMPPFKHTKNYVNTVMKEYKYQKANPDIAIKNAQKKQTLKSTPQKEDKEEKVQEEDIKEVEVKEDLVSML